MNDLGFPTIGPITDADTPGSMIEAAYATATSTSSIQYNTTVATQHEYGGGMAAPAYQQYAPERLPMNLLDGDDAFEEVVAADDDEF